jgi:uncharacterized protein with ParB-like and HNH nuclease domain
MTLREIISKINANEQGWFLPTIQREFVWNADKINNLFDSVMRGFPFGQIVIWKPENTASIRKYEFVKDIDERERNHENKLAKSPAAYLVLDGQQRLTSFYVGLCGQFIREYRRKIQNRYLYINALYLEQDAENDAWDGLYGFDFITEKEAQQITETQVYIKISDLLDSEFTQKSQCEQWKTKVYADLYRRNPEIVQKNEVRIKEISGMLWNNILYCDIPVMEIDKSNDEILTVFTRLNTGGVTLEKSELLLSFMENDPALFRESGGARKTIKDFRYKIDNRDSNPIAFDKKVSFDLDAILKACLVFSAKEIQYKIKNFSDNAQSISEEWDKISKYLEIVLNLCDRYGLDKYALTAHNLLIIVAYYIMKKYPAVNNFVKTSDASLISEHQKIIEWLTVGSLTGVIGRGSSDTILTQFRKYIDENTELPKLPNKPDKESIGEILDNVGYGGKNCQLLLLILTPHRYWAHSQDHIFARGRFKNNPALAQYEKYMNSIYNLQLLGNLENIQKTDSGILDWLNGQTLDMKKQLLIPDDATLLDDNHFNAFIQERRKIMQKKLCDFFDI